MSVETLPLPATQGAPAAAPSAGSPSAGGAGLVVGTLGNVTPDYAGTLEEGAGGFGVDMWRGTERGLVERLLPQLPPALTSPAMRELERRLLLSNAEAPAASANGGGANAPVVNLFTARADRLWAMGLAKDAAALLALTPSAMVDAVAARLRIDALLLAGDVAGACKAVDDTRAVASADRAWQEAQIFCQLRAGQKDQAALGLDLLQEQGGVDPVFVKLAQALGGQKISIESLPAPTPLELAMLREAGLPLPRDVVQSGDPNILTTIATDPALDVALRLAAAEQSTAGGGLPVEQLEQAYASITFAPGDLADPIGASARDPGPAGRALLYQAAGITLQPRDRARLVQAALDRARHQGGYLLAVQVNMTYLLPVVPAPDLAWFAGDAGRALYAAGHYEQANAWLQLAESQAAGNPQAAAAVSELAVYARIAGVGAPIAWDPAALAQWRQAAGTNPGAQRLFAIFDGLGEPLGGGWSMIGQPAAAPAPTGAATVAPPAGAPADPALLFNLGDAAGKHRIGETVLLSLYALGSGGPAGCDPLSLSRVIASLIQVGLDAEARAIAIEAAIAAGV
jgi:hypothetical protein